MRHHLFLEFWLVDTWFFTHWRHHRDVTYIEYVRQPNIRRGKKLGFQLSHKHALLWNTIFTYHHRYQNAQRITHTKILSNFALLKVAHVCQNFLKQYSKAPSINEPDLSALCET